MRPIYECPDNNVSAILADDCARIIIIIIIALTISNAP